MTESKPLMEMDPAPSEQSTQSRMFSSGLSAPGQREGHFCLSSCEPVLIFSFNFFFNLFFNSAESLQRPVPQHSPVRPQAGAGVGRHGGDAGGPAPQNRRALPR